MVIGKIIALILFGLSIAVCSIWSFMFSLRNRSLKEQVRDSIRNYINGD